MLKTVQFSLAQDQSLDSDALIENNNVYQRERKLFIDALIKNRGEGEISALLNTANSPDLVSFAHQPKFSMNRSLERSNIV